MDSPKSGPPARSTTVRRELSALLSEHPQTARELSQRASLPEREVASHLQHLMLSARGQGKRLQRFPARCLGCGFRFETREKLTAPSRCPKCRSERIEPPRFFLG